MATHWPVASNSKPWKGQTSRPPHMRPPCSRPQIRAQVRADGLGDTDSPIFVAPDDDALSHPSFLDELGLQYVKATCNKVPALGKRGKQRCVCMLPSLGCHHSTLLRRNLGATASLPTQDTLPGCESHLPIPPRVRMRCFRDVTTHPAGQGTHILALPMTLSGVRAQVIYPREHEWRCSRERSTDLHIKQLNYRSCPSELLQPGGVS